MDTKVSVVGVDLSSESLAVVGARGDGCNRNRPIYCTSLGSAGCSEHRSLARQVVLQEEARLRMSTYHSIRALCRGRL